jgi:MFS family permease
VVRDEKDGVPVNGDGDPRRWRALALVSFAVLLGMSVWFTASAVAPELESRWDLSSNQVAWLTTLVQLGFVVGTVLAAVMNLADLVPSRIYFSISAISAAAVNALLVGASGYEGALILRFFTGFFLAGVYPPAMKMMATWFRSARGFAIGTVVGALTVGKATPYLFKLLGGAPVSVVVWGASGGAVLGGLLVAVAYREGPNPFRRAPFSWGLVAEVVRHRPTRLATYGYLGHMWELYAMWTWVPAFLAASAAARTAANAAGAMGAAGTDAGAAMTNAVNLAAFSAIAVGGIGCVWGGWMADRIGRGRFVNLAMAVSGVCSIAVGAFFGQSFWILLPLVLVWGLFVVADSAQFSVMVTEVAPQQGVGTALTLQTSVGFLITMVTIQGVPVLQESFGWGLTFPVLALGPVLGIVAIRKFDEGRQAS